MVKDTHYILKVGEQGVDRLAILGNVYLPSSARFLTENGLKPGMQVADIGCGTGNMSRWFASQVGPSGSVTGIDISSEQLAVAERKTKEEGLTNVKYLTCNIYDIATLNKQFDLVYCRFVLAHLDRSKTALNAMYQLVKPAGILVCEEIEARTWYGYPPSKAYDRHIELFNKLGEKHAGVDFNIGPKIYGYFRELNCHSIHVNIAQPIFMGEEQKRHAELVTLECAQTFLEAGLATQEEIYNLVVELHQLAKDDNFLMVGARVFQVTGRKPN